MNSEQRIQGNKKLSLASASAFLSGKKLNEQDPFAPVLKESPHAWYVLILLALIYSLSFLDRGLLSLVIGPIKTDLNVTDIQVSFLLGLSFVLLYCVFSIPAGFLADKYNRTRIIAIAISLWSVMELVCGQATSYGQLFIGRAGLGIGEAAVAPAAYSIIRDIFPAHRRGLPYALFALGASIGTALALVFSGSLLGAVHNGDVAGIPWLGTLHPWQVVLVVPVAIGVPLAVLIALVRDPIRRNDGSTHESSAASPAFSAAARHLLKHWNVYLPLWLSFSFCAMPAFNNAWAPEAVVRFWHMPRPVVGHSLGMIQLVCSIIGNLGGGLVLNFVGRRGVAVMMWVATVSVTLSLVILGVILGMNTLSSIVWLWAFALIFTPICNPTVATIQAHITPSHLMGKVIAIYYTVANLIAVGIGPTLVAFVVGFMHGPRAMANALVLTNMGCLVAGIAMMLTSVVQLSKRNRASPTLESFSKFGKAPSGVHAE
jgi:MFS family permease